MTDTQEYYNRKENVVDWSMETELYPVERFLLTSFLPPPPAKILDVGCGSGRTTGDLVKMGYSVVAVDLAEELLKIAAQRVPSTPFIKMNAARLGLKSHSFDAALFSFNGIDCVYPVSERLHVYQEIQRILRPGGVFYYTSHNVIGQLGRSVSREGLLSNLTFLKRQFGSLDMFAGYWKYGPMDNKQTLFASGLSYELKQIKRLGWQILFVCGVKKFKSNQYVSWSSTKKNISGSLNLMNGKPSSSMSLAINCAHIHYLCKV